jgi:translation elongation factor EF-Tu-like GTPase
MKRKFIEVDDTFLIKGRGLVITGWMEENTPHLKVGDSVEILRPDGTKVNSQVKGIEIICRKDFSKGKERENIGFMLKDLSKEDIPIGSIIFLTD